MDQIEKKEERPQQMDPVNLILPRMLDNSRHSGKKTRNTQAKD
jgi:hypothetical protein